MCVCVFFCFFKNVNRFRFLTIGINNNTFVKSLLTVYDILTFLDKVPMFNSIRNDSFNWRCAMILENSYLCFKFYTEEEGVFFSELHLISSFSRAWRSRSYVNLPLSNSWRIVCWVPIVNAAFSLVTKARKWKKIMWPNSFAQIQNSIYLK